MAAAAAMDAEHGGGQRLPWELIDRILAHCDARTLAAFAQTCVGGRELVERLNARPRFVVLYATQPNVEEAVSDVRAGVGAAVPCRTADSATVGSGRLEGLQVLRRGLDRPFLPDAAIVLWTEPTDSRGLCTLRALGPAPSSLVRRQLPARTLLLGCNSYELIASDEGQANRAREFRSDDDSGAAAPVVALLLLRLPGASMRAYGKLKDFVAAVEATPLAALPSRADAARQLAMALVPSRRGINAVRQVAVPHVLRMGGIVMSQGGFFASSAPASRSEVGLLFTLHGPRLAFRYALVSGVGDEVEATLRRCIPVGRQYLGCFLVACYARGANMHGQEDFEPQVFHKLYPAVPILGIFSGGEMGPVDLGHLHEVESFGMVSLYCVMEWLS